MSNLTRRKSPFNPWLIGLPFLPAARSLEDRAIDEVREMSWSTRFRCRLRRRAIDQELRAGVDPDSTDCRRARATELAAVSERRALAASCERLLTRSEAPLTLTASPLNRREIRAAAPLLHRLAQRLREEPSVRVQGVARARLMLTEETSFLYDSRDQLRLVDQVRSVLVAL